MEYVALSEASHEAFWLRNVYEELGLLQEDTPMEIRGNNEGSIAMAKNCNFTSAPNILPDVGIGYANLCKTKSSWLKAAEIQSKPLMS